MRNKALTIAALAVFVLVGVALTASSADAHRRYVPYHHYSYGYYPGPVYGNCYTYDPYPYYRAYTFTHPPVYGGGGFYYGHHNGHDSFGISVPGFSFHYH